MPVYRFDLTAADVATTQLRHQQAVDEGALEVALASAVTVVRQALIAMGIGPDSITDQAFPDDYEWCRQTCSVGAAAWYLANVTGSDTGETMQGQEFTSRVRAVRQDPAVLQSYQALNTSQGVARGPWDLDREAAERASARILDPANPRSWRL
jgi:hypothetical protein